MKMRWLLPLPLLLLIHVTGRSEGEFSYREHEKWGGVCQKGMRQSPIDLRLKLSNFERVDQMFFLKYEEASHFEVQNNGHTIKLKLDQPCNYMIAGGGLPGVYYLDHIHFHWRAEHTIEGKRMPMEAHFVHYRNDFKNVGEAVSQPNGLAVLGVLFQESAEENKVLRELLPYFGNFSENPVTPKYHLAPISLLPKYKASFFRYPGSLTTPTCDETVVWTVFRDMQPISKSQIDVLNNIFFHGDKENYRPIQKLNNRKLAIMTFEDKSFKPPLSCAKPSKAEKAFCFLLAMAGVIPAFKPF